MNDKWVMEGGRIKLFKDCGCEAVVGDVKFCRDHDLLSPEEYYAWEKKVLAEVNEAQQQHNKSAWLREILQRSDDDR